MLILALTLHTLEPDTPHTPVGARAAEMPVILISTTW